MLNLVLDEALSSRSRVLTAQTMTIAARGQQTGACASARRSAIAPVRQPLAIYPFHGSRNTIETAQLCRSVRLEPAYWATLTPFCFSGFGGTLDRLTAQKMNRISFLVECLYAG